MEEKTHSWLSPSGFKPIMAGCVGKPFMEKGMPERKAGVAAERGTLIHFVAEKMITKALIDLALFDSDVVEIAKGFVEYVEKIWQELDELRFHNVDVFVEYKVKVFPEYGIEGTSDTFIWSGSGVLHCIDLKTGRIPVSVVENWQLIGYVHGFLRDFPQLVCREVIFHIYQPGNPQDPWAVSYHDLITNYVPKLEKNCKEAYELYEEIVKLDVTHLSINSDCQYCRALGQCPAARKHLSNQALVLFDDSSIEIPRVADLTIQQKVNIFKVKKLLLAYLEEVEVSLHQDLTASVDVPDLIIKPGKNVRKWSSNESYVVETLTELGLDPFRRNLITITEAEKLLKKKKSLLPEDVFEITQQKDQIVVKSLTLLENLEDL